MKTVHAQFRKSQLSRKLRTIFVWATAQGMYCKSSVRMYVSASLGGGGGRTGFFRTKVKIMNKVTLSLDIPYSSTFFFINICSLMRSLDGPGQAQGVQTPWPCSCGAVVYLSIAETLTSLFAQSPNS
jgi:hypothetical protein